MRRPDLHERLRPALRWETGLVVALLAIVLLGTEVSENRAHGRDERIPVKSFYEGLEYLYRLTRMLAGGN